MLNGERHARRKLESGFTYIGLLIVVALMGILLAAVGEVASTVARHEHETELLFIGNEYRNAIARFFQQNHRYPAALEELLESNDGPKPSHYLRRLYRDPMTGAVDWTLVPAAQGFMGVASSSTQLPLKRAGFDFADESFEKAESYADWTFVFYPWIRRLAPASQPTPPVGPRSQ
jgi:type II secretory pathway pseudopilin PulG